MIIRRIKTEIHRIIRKSEICRIIIRRLNKGNTHDNKEDKQWKYTG